MLGLSVLVAASAVGSVGDFKSEQMRFPRVREAFQEKLGSARTLFAKSRLPFPNRYVFLRAFKQEEVIELWAASSSRGEYKLVKKYRVTAGSGELGPKRVQGDGQVPEGFYEITTFNPNSQFWLSMRVNYPNASDRILSHKERPGTDIYIHGNQVSIGCMPIGDDEIKELYVIMVEARSAGQKRMPVHMFPFRLTDDAMVNIERLFANPPETVAFWRNLKAGYDLFEKKRRPPAPTVGKDGFYRFSR